jgi:hypothetical protein
MRKEKKASPTELPLGFEIDPEPVKETWTARAGIPLLVEACRRLGVSGSVKRNLTVKQRDRGFDEATMVESFIILNAAGGECLDDFENLREDEGLSELIGHKFPSPAAARYISFTTKRRSKRLSSNCCPDKKRSFQERMKRCRDWEK